MVVCKGDVFWASLPSGGGSEPAYQRPVVVVQRDSINRSKFLTVVVVPLTKQTRHAILPGNVLLKNGEANLPSPSLARGTHVMVMDKNRLTEKIGTLSPERTEEIIQNIVWVMGQTPKVGYSRQAGPHAE
ncbi:MAG: type II toxin-antitoxin system PemK/MazF family toxin [Deltaproteobacteria bacterium]|nr:type II toxin-antitoxin system PemK/MazF family toxin [Deltaproteobacteria bacterium]